MEKRTIVTQKSDFKLFMAVEVGLEVGPKTAQTYWYMIPVQDLEIVTHYVNDVGKQIQEQLSHQIRNALLDGTAVRIK